jgi:hypothetical protein
MRFIASDGTEKKVTLEQADGDVIVRVDNLAVVALRAQEGVLAVSGQAVADSGLTHRVE